MEKLLHSVSGALHILAAVTWIGSMIYSEFAVMPALKQLGAPRSKAINMIASGHFSSLTWASVAVLIVTGIFAISDNQEKLSPVFAKPAGIVLTIKLLLVGALIIILLVQVYTFGPRIKRLINPATPKDQENALEMARINNTTKWWSRTHLTLGVLVIILAVILSELLA
jgi:putative copper resistance protein D